MNFSRAACVRVRAADHVLEHGCRGPLRLHHERYTLATLATLAAEERWIVSDDLR